MSASLSAYTGATEPWWLTLLTSSRRKEIKYEPHSNNILIGALPGPTRIIPQVYQVSKVSKGQSCVTTTQSQDNVVVKSQGQRKHLLQ